MKRMILLISIFLALTLTAGAQTMIDFTSLPDTGTPQAIPENYAGLHWTGLDYVSCMMWDYVNGNIEWGDGFMIGPEAQVAFAGGPMCYAKHGGNTNENVCQASIAAGVGPNALTEFRPDYAVMALGWKTDGKQFVTVDAYNNGVKIATQRFNLQVAAQKYKLVFPNSWGEVTQLVFHPSPGGAFVMYVLQLK